MCDTGNLIDLSGCDEPDTDTTEAIEECIIVESTHFKGPYDPFDSMEKEACIKGLNKIDEKPSMQKQEKVGNIQLEYSDQDLNNETPPVAMDFEPSSDAIKVSESQTLQKQVIQLNALKMSSMGTPPPHHLSTKFSRNAMLTENLQMIAAESPIKLIEDEPNLVPEAAATTLSDDTCSNVEFEARLKQLRIAMLESPIKSKPAAIKPSPKTEPQQATGNVGKLLQDLQSLVCQHVDVSQRQQFDTLIASISAAVQTSPPPAVDELMPSYKRQATFDLDLVLQQKKSAECAEYVVGSKMQDFPDAMTCSSATFDGESLATDKAIIPIIDSDDISLPSVPQKQESYLTEVVNDNLALQINELLERHKLTKLKLSDTVPQCDDPESTKPVGGPTVILVVNSTVGNQLPSYVVQPHTLSKTQTQHPSSNQTADCSSKANTFRRRSSSLSIHDKSKQERPKSLVKQSSGDSSNVSVNVNIGSHPMPLKELSVVGDKFNAMSSYRQRRNSFTVGSKANGGAAANASVSMISHGRALASGRIKAPTINETNIKSLAAATKDAIPIKRVAPMVKPSMLTTDVKHLNSTVPRCPGQETPMPIRSKPGGNKLFCTSTPMPQMRRSFKPMGSNYSSSASSLATATTTTPNVRSMGYGKKSGP
ncbi:uncharacterized protein LOC132796291 [Drosophila nasuta]|uniref:uncharacterized protein LOC132796291 n=1 Tax=Drosophila nasuta TaxID=42062 RepID=UPI00295F3F0D|nr:uncharacterized protein LOC132796291 [Drosophila nasuta]